MNLGINDDKCNIQKIINNLKSEIYELEEIEKNLKCEFNNIFSSSDEVNLGNLYSEYANELEQLYVFKKKFQSYYLALNDIINGYRAQSYTIYKDLLLYQKEIEEEYL